MKKFKLSWLFYLAGILCIVLGFVCALFFKPLSTQSEDTSADESAPLFSVDASSASDGAESAAASAPEEEISGAVSVTFDHYTDHGEYAVITGTAETGEKRWSVTTAAYEVMQLDQICGIGVWDDLYLYTEDGTVVALNMTDGSEAWRNSDFGGADASGCFDENHAFLCGYMGPDVLVLDHAGSTVRRIDSLNADYMWPYAMKCADGVLTISYESNAVMEKEDVEYSVSDILDAQDTAAAIVSAADPMDALKEVSATSHLEEANLSLVHDAGNAVDGDLNTAWVEGVEGNGEGESITLTFDGEQLISGFGIYNGYQKGDTQYYNNARPARLKLAFSDGTTLTFDLADEQGEQVFYFEQPVTTDFVTFTIISVYNGSSYRDTCISELAVY